MKREPRVTPSNIKNDKRQIESAMHACAHNCYSMAVISLLLLHLIKLSPSRGRWSRRIERLISKTIPTLAYFGDLFFKENNYLFLAALGFLLLPPGFL